MPKYEYHCSACDEHFVFFHSPDESRTDCPNCESANTLRRMLSFTIRKATKSSAATTEQRLKKHFDDAKEELRAQKEELRKDYVE